MMRQAALLDALEPRYGNGLSLLQVGPGRPRAAKVLLFCFRGSGNTPFLVCRVSRSAQGERQLRHEAAVRAEIRAYLGPDLQAAMPAADLLDLEEGVCLFEPYLAGRTLTVPQGPGTIDPFAELTLGWWAGFRKATACKRVGTGDLASKVDLAGSAARELDLIGEILSGSRALEGLSIAPQIRRWTRELASCSDVLHGLAPCAVHGDFWYGNMHLDADRLRVVDWEYAEAAGNPLFDPALNLIALVRELRGLDQVEWFERCFLEATPLARRVGRIVDRYLDNPPREAFAYTVAQVVPRFAARACGLAAAGWGHHARLLARVMREPDPVASISAALWPAS